MASIYSGSDAGKSGLEMVELDGSPDIRGVSKIKVSNTTLTDDGNGEVTLITGGGGGGSGTVTEVSTGVGLQGGPITTTGTIALTDTAVTPAVYTNATITVNQKGRITAASSGGTITVPNGGTGLTTVTSGSLVIGQGTAALKALGVATNGQLLIGSTGADPELATLASAGGTVTITNGGGTINLEAAAGGVTLSGSTNNTISTVTGANALQGEANLTFDGTVLTVTGNLAVGVNAASTVGFMGVTAVTQQSATLPTINPVDPSGLVPLAASADANFNEIQGSIDSIVQALQAYGLLQ